MSTTKGWIPTTCFYKIMKLKKRIKAIWGGSSSGKTFNVIAKFYQDAVDNPGEINSICSNTLANLKKGAIRDFKNILLSRGVWDPNCWRITDSTYTLNNGSVVEFIGLDDETKARGPRRNRLFIDEANRVSFDVYQQLVRRTDKEVILSWNPSGAFWYNEYIMNDVDHDQLITNFKDNEALNENQLQYFIDLEKQSKRSEFMLNEWKVYGLGEWGALEGACIKDYKRIDGIPDGFRLKGVGLDFGNNDPNAAVALYMNDGRQFIADEILYKNKMEIQQIYDKIKPYDANIYADYSWPQTIQQLNFMSKKAKKRAKVFKCKKGPDSIKAGIDLINEVDLSVTKRSKNLLMEFESYAYAKDKNEHLIDGKYQGPDHLVDALRYVLGRVAIRRKTGITQITLNR